MDGEKMSKNFVLVIWLDNDYDDTLVIEEGVFIVKRCQKSI